MPRTARASVGGICYHVLNRGNARADVFHKDGDFAAFTELIAASNERLPMRVLAHCLLNNHFHLVLWPHNDGDLSRWMQWLLTSHVRRYHRHYHSSGHVWQGRFKAFPVQEDDHLLAVLRYVERNPLRANLVKRAEQWPWSSLAWRVLGQRPEMLADWPIGCPVDWLKRVNRPQSKAEEEHCVARSTVVNLLVMMLGRSKSRRAWVWSRPCARVAAPAEQKSRMSPF